MSEVLTHPSSLDSDRPDEVTDPLLWKLALAVADTHEPDGDGGCRILLCADQPWPCAAWNSAQRALQAARATAPATIQRRPTSTPSIRAAAAA